MASDGYQLDDLLELVMAERADGTRLTLGKPPCVVIGGAAHDMEGPPVPVAETDHFLRAMASRRQVREFWQAHLLEFDYVFRRTHPFRVYATDDGESVMLELQWLES